MASAAYQLVVRELEALLPPRIVSQSLHEGLASLGKTPATVSADDLSAILKSKLYPRLQLTQSAPEARARIERLVAQLPRNAAAAPFSLRAQARAVEVLQNGLQPFHLLFEWGETQRLRAQLQLVATEHAGGRDAGELIAAATAQLELLRRKLEEQLVVQAAELTALEAALGDLKAHTSVHPPKLRRLETVLTLVRRAHEARQRAPAEIERAHTLVGELQAETERIGAESARQLAAQARELTALERRFAALLALEPETARQLSAYRAQLSAKEPLGDALNTLSAQLMEAQETLQEALRSEFSTLYARLNEAHSGESPAKEREKAGERAEGTPLHAALLRDLLLTLKVLETTLPTPTDVQRIRDLARVQGPDTETLLRFHQLESSALPYRDLEQELARALDRFLRAARAQFELHATLPELTAGWALLERVHVESEAQARAFGERLNAAERAAETLAHLSNEETLSLHWTLRGLRAQREASDQLSPKLRAELEPTLGAAERLLSSVQSDAETTRTVARQLVSTHALDDALGFSAEPPLAGEARHLEALEPSPAQHGLTQHGLTQPSPTSPDRGDAPNGTAETQRAILVWLEQQRTERGVSGIALFADAPLGTEDETTFELVVGDLRAEPQALRRAAKLLRNRADALGDALEQGEVSFVTLETDDCTLLITYLQGGERSLPAEGERHEEQRSGYTLVLVTTAPLWGGAARQVLEAALPELEAQLSATPTP